ncbi:MupG family TIM beta-alpha barrel fold protein, partial [Enterococcus faecalis]|uniref:MupG family TIM beta-alpha barrel fold protein n=2 Tax=Enterococcus TaxID=1350 RepID=UPI002478244B
HKIDIGLNASTITLEEVAELKAHQADFSRLEAWHNYYPRPETGIGTTFFNEKNRWLKELGLQVFTFVPGDGQTRGPIFAGLPTLEKHRGQNPFAAAVGLMADPYVDAVYIGDPTISERTMAQFGYYHQTNQFLLEVAPSKSRYLKRILGTHTNRLDAARDVLRSELSRTSEMFRKDEIATIESEQTEARPVGTVTIDNEKYGRYMGEIQVTLVDLPKDEKVNTITRII